MKAKITLAIGLLTAVLCIVGILMTACQATSEFGGIVVGVLILIILLGLYITALLLKKLKMIWIVISAWVALWIFGLFMEVLSVVEPLSETGLLIGTVAEWPYYVFDYFFKSPESLSIKLWSGILFTLTTALLWIGVCGVNRHVITNNKSSEAR